MVNAPCAVLDGVLFATTVAEDVFTTDQLWIFAKLFGHLWAVRRAPPGWQLFDSDVMFGKLSRLRDVVGRYGEYFTFGERDMSTGMGAISPREEESKNALAGNLETCSANIQDVSGFDLPGACFDALQVQALRDNFVSAHGLSALTMLQLLSQRNLISLSHIYSSGSIADQIIDNIPEVRSVYEQLCGAHTFTQTFRWVASFGRELTPAQRFRQEVQDAARQLVETLGDKGLVSVSTSRHVMTLSISGCAGLVEPVPCTGTTVSLTALGRAALSSLKDLLQER